MPRRIHWEQMSFWFPWRTLFHAAAASQVSNCDVRRDSIHRAVHAADDLLGLGISFERIRGRLSSLKLRLVRLLQTGDYALALHRPGRYRLFCVCGRLAGISHSGVDFRVAERERTGERPKKAAVVG